MSVLKFPPLFLALLLATAGAEPAKPAPAKVEKRKLTPEELFAKLDQDHNGSLNLEEFRGFFKTKPEEAQLSLAFRKKDRNANGQLTLAEFLAGLPPAEAPAPAGTPATPAAVK